MTKVKDIEIIPFDQWRADGRVALHLIGKTMYIGSIDHGWARMNSAQLRELRDDLNARFPPAEAK